MTNGRWDQIVGEGIAMVIRDRAIMMNKESTMISENNNNKNNQNNEYLRNNTQTGAYGPRPEARGANIRQYSAIFCS